MNTSYEVFFMNSKYRYEFGATGIVASIMIPMGLLLLSLGIIFYFKINHLLAILISLGSVGFAMVIAGTITLIVNINHNKTKKMIMENGMTVYAEFEKSVINYNVKVNRRHPHIAHFTYRDSSGETHRFKSGYLFFSPDNELKGKTVPVKVNPDNMKQYYLDLSGVFPELYSSED